MPLLPFTSFRFPVARFKMHDLNGERETGNPKAAARRRSQNSIWSGPSALFTYCDLFPGALPQAGIERAFGAQKS
jgi:hypothetical protein